MVSDIFIDFQLFYFPTKIIPLPVTIMIYLSHNKKKQSRIYID